MVNTISGNSGVREAGRSSPEAGGFGNWLTLSTIHLQPEERWSREGEGFVFVFLTAGTARYLISGTIRSLLPGDVLVANARRGTVVWPADGTACTLLTFGARREQLVPLFGGADVSLLQPFMDAFCQPKVYAPAGNVARTSQDILSQLAPPYNLQHRAQLLRIASVVLNEEVNSVRQRRVGFFSPEEHLEQIFQSLTADEIEKEPVERLAERFGCSRRHLNRLFHQYCGFSVNALRMEMRLLRAAALLRDGSMKVIHVAEECGFNHLGLFNGCFKRRFGVSPTQWRLQLAEPHHPLEQLLNGHPACPLRLRGLCAWIEKTAALRHLPHPNAGNGHSEQTHGCSAGSAVPCNPK